MRRLGLALLACWSGTGAWAGSVALQGEHQQLLVDLTGGLPARWVSCAERCTEGDGRSATLLDATNASGSRLGWDMPGDPAGTQALASVAYTAERDESGPDQVLTLTSREAFRGVHLIQRYVLPRAGYTLSASLRMPAGARLLLESGEVFVPRPLPGLAGIYTHVDAVVVTAAGQVVLTDDGRRAVGVRIADGQWVGVRNRFWALLMRPATEVTVDVRTPSPNQRRLDVGRAGDAGSVDAVFYAGPVERRRLAEVDSVLGGMLFASLWEWLRVLAFGLLALLQGWHAVVGSYGIAILLLSASVKVLTWPLTAVAERWQHEVNRIQSALAPALAAVRREFRGEEAHWRTLDVYRQHGVSPFFTVRSLLGFAIQIPIFIAAFDMLGENFSLDGTSFLWIGDLALPDRWAVLPVTLPFLGGHLNLLPFLMTGLAVLAARVQDDRSLSTALRAGQRRRLYGMALMFFFLLYPFPAGMVLYWTANNSWHLLRVVAGKLRHS